jgi:hypothetical protein
LKPAYEFRATPASGFVRAYAVPMYCTEAHRALQTAEWKSFWLVRPASRQIVAEIHFACHGAAALSPVRAPFGAFAFSGGLQADGLQQFLHRAGNELRLAGCTSIKMVMPPGPYLEAGALASVFFTEAGYAVGPVEASAFLPVSDLDFRAGLHAWERRKIRQAEAAGVVCRHGGRSGLQDIYRFLQACRAERGRQLSMSEEKIMELSEAFPKEVLWFDATRHGQRVAAVLAIRDTPQILYTLYYGHAAAANALSPVVLLLEYVYRYCRQHGAQWINLGTSTVEGATSTPLLQFKINLGAVLFNKFTFTKKFS